MSEPVDILLVDDQASNLDALEAILTRPDYRIARAGSGEEALLAMLRTDFAAVVSDIRMPGVSGFELATLIKQRKRTQHVPILFLTAHMIDEKDVIRGYGLGAVDYLSKPVNPDILRSKIEVFVDLFRKTRALAAANDALESEVDQRQLAQEALSQANEELEARVIDRTAALTETNQALRKSEDRLRIANDSLTMAQQAGGSGVWDHNLVTSETYVSPEYRDLHGFQPDVAFSWDAWMNSIHPEDRARIAAARDQLLASGGVWSEEYRILHPRRGERWLASVGRLARDDEGKPMRFSGINLDITDRKRTEEELAHYRAHLEQLVDEQTRKLQQSMEQLRRSERLASVGTLATGIAHEINNPLNAILLATQFALRAPGHANFIESLECIKRETERAGRIVKNLLRFTRDERTNKTPSDMNLVVRHVAGLIRSYIPEHTVELELDLEPDLPQVSMNTTEIEQVVVNLIKNAVEAGGPGVQISVKTRRVQDRVMVVVADSGPGIPLENQPHIYDPFFTTKRTAGGTGLGLSLCHGIVAEHGGRIHLESRPECGATFTLEFPCTNGQREYAWQES